MKSINEKYNADMYDGIDDQYETDMAEDNALESSELIQVQGIDCWLNRQTYVYKVWVKGMGDIASGYNRDEAIINATIRLAT